MKNNIDCLKEVIEITENISIVRCTNRLFSFEREQIGKILETTINFTMEYLENNLPELIEEIETLAGKPIPADVINNAVEEVYGFVDNLHYWMMHTLIADDGKWNYRKDRASRYYLKVLDTKSSLIIAPYDNENGQIISLPFFVALGETTTRIFDYSIAKSPQMKYRLHKSNNYHRRKMFEILDRRSPKYYFIKVLKDYGANPKQLIRNMSNIFSNDKSVLKILEKLPPLYR